MIVIKLVLLFGLVSAIPIVFCGNFSGPGVLLPSALGQVSNSGFGDANSIPPPQDPSALGAGGPGDPGTDTNTTDSPPDISSNLGSPDQNDTFGSPDMSNPEAAIQIPGPDLNVTNMSAQEAPISNQPVPEFGPLPSLTLGASIVVSLVIGQRIYSRFKP